VTLEEVRTVLRISAEQYQRLSEMARQDFRRRAFQHLIRVHPEFVAARDDHAVLEWIDETTQRARLYDIDHEAEVVGFIELTIRHGRRFDLDPEKRWARDILSNGDLTDAEKIDELRLATEGELEEEFEEPADEGLEVGLGRPPNAGPADEP
jgi:hypothetical protein